MLLFEILGPIRVRVNHVEVAITARREQVLLAMLLLQPDRRVGVEQLIDAIWASSPPRDAVGQIQGSVYRLRKRLAAAGLPDGVISTEPGGYRLGVDPQSVDLWRFRRVRDEARVLAATGSPDAVRQRYRTALALWRGPALAGVGSDPVRQAAAALDDERAQAQEECIEVELALGGGGELVAELTDLVAQHPYREGLHGALMLALYRAGRQADALASYRRIRKVLHDDLGTEPGHHLQQLHQAILNREPDPASPRQATDRPVPPDRPTPRELPADVAGFTGRYQALRALNEMLEDGTATSPPPVIVSAIAGTAGVGKTALAIHWSHQVADRFPDGQLYLNLRGYAVQPPLRAIEALEALLRSLGTLPEQIPADETQAANLYRSQLAGRRALIVLDNVRSVEQVRPLLPGSRGCLVLVTSRDRLSGLIARDDARRITLDMFTEGEAHRLLTRVLGTERVQAESDAAANLARLCVYLPLALRIAAANLADCPTCTIADYVADLSERDRVTALEVEGDPESAVWAAFNSSYRSIPADAQQMFRLLGLLPGEDFTPAAAAALAGTSTGEARRLLRRLTSAHLVEECMPGRFTFHDLMREYAHARAYQDDTEPDVRTAIQRLLSWYLRTTDIAVDLLYPSKFGLERPAWDASLPEAPFARSADALTWLNSELTNLVTAVSDAAKNGPFTMAWLVADSLCRFLMFCGHRARWQAVASSALTAAERHGDPRSQAAMHYSLAQLCLSTNRYVEAEAHANAILVLLKADGWPECEAEALILLASVLWRRGQLSEAVGPLSQALKTFKQIDDVASQSVVLSYLGVVERSLGRLQDSTDHSMEALALSRRLGIRNREVLALQNLGVTTHLLGLLDDARERLESALAISRELGDRPAEAGTQETLAAIHRDAGRYTKALKLANQALDLSREMDDKRCEAESLNTLASIQLRLGNAEQALQLSQEALDLARATGDVGPHADALLGLASAHHARGEVGAALANTQVALDLVRVPGYRVLEGQSLAQLAEISFGQGRHEDALGHARQALENHRTTGHKLGEARALSLLWRIAQADGDLGAAEDHRRAALDIYSTIGAAPQVEGG